MDDAAVLRPGLTDETRVQARLRQTPLRRHAALQIGDDGKRSRHAALQIGDKWSWWWQTRRGIGGGRREKLLGVDGGGVGGRWLGVSSPELLLRGGGGGGRGRLGEGEEILGERCRGGGVRSGEGGVTQAL